MITTYKTDADTIIRLTTQQYEVGLYMIAQVVENGVPSTTEMAQYNLNESDERRWHKGRRKYLLSQGCSIIEADSDVIKEWQAKYDARSRK